MEARTQTLQARDGRLYILQDITCAGRLKNCFRHFWYATQPLNGVKMFDEWGGKYKFLI